jgi:KUP system potassium uptake protein
VALPGLLLNYFGQGALLLGRPEAITSPFYNMVPSWGLLPIVGLSTLATIIASQALISGAFSVTRQALMLGFLPRVRIQHTSAHQIGQIYVPIVNWLLMMAAVMAVWGFKSSSGLAAAYGVAVTLDMTITTLLAYVVARIQWGWGRLPALAVTIPLLCLELTFLSSNLTKIAHGGWFPLTVGAVMYTIFTTWRRGRQILFRKVKESMVPLEDLYELMRVERPARVPGTAVYMTGSDVGTPPALLQGFLHMRAVHERVLLLTIVTEKVARVPEAERVRVEQLTHGFWRAIARYGFMETPNVPDLLKRSEFVSYSLEFVTFFLGRETVLANEHSEMTLWRERLFAFLTRNAQPATAFFGIPPSRVMEIGSQIEI